MITQSVTKKEEIQSPISNFEKYLNSLQENTAEPSNAVTSRSSVYAFKDALDRVEQQNG